MKAFNYRILTHETYVSIEFECPLCKELHYIDLFEKADIEKAIDYLNGKGLAQDVLKGFSNETREKFISGYCPDCQTALFGLGESMDSYDYDLFQR